MKGDEVDEGDEVCVEGAIDGQGDRETGGR